MLNFYNPGKNQRPIMVINKLDTKTDRSDSGGKRREVFYRTLGDFNGQPQICNSPKLKGVLKITPKE